MLITDKSSLITHVSINNDKLVHTCHSRVYNVTVRYAYMYTQLHTLLGLKQKETCSKGTHKYNRAQWHAN